MNPAMTEAERNQARKLHHRQAQGELSEDAERALVQRFLQTVSEEDVARRAAATPLQDARIAAKEARNEKLAALLQRQERMVQTLREALAQAETERREIARERQQIESVPL